MFQKPDIGLLILRVIIGGIFIVHGVMKFMAGEDALEGVGSAMELIGIDFMPMVWGALAAAVEILGGVALIVGFGTRIASALLLFVMIIATVVKIDAGADFGPGISHPLKMCGVFLALIFLGAGQYSIDKK